MLHARRISNRALAARAGRSSEFIGRVLLGHARPPAWLQELLVEVLQRPVADLFTAPALAASPRFPGDASLLPADSASS